MKPLVIFGTGDVSELAHYYFSKDSGYQVAAFTVDAAYMTDSGFCGLPVVALEEIESRYPRQPMRFSSPWAIRRSTRLERKNTVNFLFSNRMARAPDGLFDPPHPTTTPA